MSYKVKEERSWIKFVFSSPTGSLQPLAVSVMSAGCVHASDVTAKPASVCL